MTGPTTAGHRFELVDPPDAAALVSQSVSVAPYRHQARIRVHAPLEEVAALVPATVGVLEASDDGDTVLTTGAHDLDAIALHLGLLGLGFTVLEPVELIDRLWVLADRLTTNHPRPS
jgi:predicted DNA-binding transcriptional regulator YafY